jgi:serine/threonine protein kinase
MAPELRDGVPYDKKIDVWAIGTVAALMAVPVCSLRRLHIAVMSDAADGSLRAALLDKVRSRGFSDTFADFVDAALQEQPSKRPSVSELLNHSLLAKAALSGAAVREESPMTGLGGVEGSQGCSVAAATERPTAIRRHRVRRRHGGAPAGRLESTRTERV